MSNIESYLIAAAFISVCGVFGGASSELVELQRTESTSPGSESGKRLIVLLGGVISFVYSILWLFASNPIAIYTIGFLIAYILGASVGREYYRNTKGIRLSIFGLAWIPITYHLISPFIEKIIP